MQMPCLSVRSPGELGPLDKVQYIMLSLPELPPEGGGREGAGVDDLTQQIRELGELVKVFSQGVD